MELTDDEKNILAYTLLGEANTEGTRGMQAVMNVIVNRSGSGKYPTTLVGVATQKNSSGVHQFSTWNTTKHGGNSPMTRFSTSSKEFRQAMAVVNQAANGSLPQVAPKGSLQYAVKIPDSWDTSHGTTTIGRHTFVNPAVSSGLRQTDLQGAKYGARGDPAHPATSYSTMLHNDTHPHPEDYQAIDPVLLNATHPQVARSLAQTLGQRIASAPDHPSSNAPAAHTRGIVNAPSDSGLITHRVQLVTIDPRTGMPGITHDTTVDHSHTIAAPFSPLFGNDVGQGPQRWFPPPVVPPSPNRGSSAVIAPTVPPSPNRHVTPTYDPLAGSHTGFNRRPGDYTKTPAQAGNEEMTAGRPSNVPVPQTDFHLLPNSAATPPSNQGSSAGMAGRPTPGAIPPTPHARPVAQTPVSPTSGYNVRTGAYEVKKPGEMYTIGPSVHQSQVVPQGTTTQFKTEDRLITTTQRVPIAGKKSATDTLLDIHDSRDKATMAAQESAAAAAVQYHTITKQAVVKVRVPVQVPIARPVPVVPPAINGTLYQPGAPAAPRAITYSAPPVGWQTGGVFAPDSPNASFERDHGAGSVTQSMASSSRWNTGY